ncbi:glutamate receptor ionotropic, kainate 3-like [Diorhabda carinulata]|uniref:glutamate receptor ionotropic, kainate 3-like n=1 Tax=Diorhabda carinulata TaxID=1163345 RepID=UPI0025A296E4|nr:glutamate receptor ionotropic, kainate 3-like [Diorhabda carinulata]
MLVAVIIRWFSVLYFTIFVNGTLTGELKIAGIFENIQLHQTAFAYSNNLYNFEKESKDVAVSHIVDSSILKDEPFTALKGTCLFLKQGIVGLFGPQSSLNLDIVQSLTERKDIPHILTRWVNPSQMGFQTINFHPSPFNLAEGYLSIIEALEWESFTILYTDIDHLLQITDLIERAKDYGKIVYTENVDPYKNGDYRSILKNAARSGQKNFVLDCPIKDLTNLLTQLQQVGLLSSGYNYFMTNLDSHTEDLSSFMYSDATITGVHLTQPNAEMTARASKELCHLYNITFKLDCGTPEIDTETALILDSVSIFLQTIKSLEITQGQIITCDSDDSWPYGLNVINTLKSGSYEGITGTIEFGNDGFRNVFQLTIYQLEGAVIEKGSWNTSTGLSEDAVLTFDEEPQDDEAADLQDRNLKVLIALTPPYAQLRESARRLTGNERYEGFAIDLIEEIASLEGFEYTFSVREDHKHGVFDTLSGKWTGMIGDVIEGRADLAISDLTINKERVEPVEFTQPFMALGISILFRKPVELPPSFFHFTEPFSISFWQYLGIAYVVIVFALFLIGRLSPNEWQRVETCKQSKKYLETDLTFLNSLWFVSSALFRQTTNVKINSISARIISATWWLFCIVLVSMYISFSLSRDAIVITEEMFNDAPSFLEYVEENDIKYGAMKGGSTEGFFKNSKNPYYEKIAQYMNDHPEDMTATTAEGIERTLEGNYAFFMESATIEYTTRRHCNLTSYGGLLDEKGFGIAVKKGSPLLVPFNKAIIKLQASGELIRLKRKWWEEKYAGDVCEEDAGSKVAPKTVEHVNGIIAITFSGIAIALVIALLEFVVHVYRISRRMKQPYGKSFSDELKKSFARKRTVQSVEDIGLTKPESGSNFSINKQDA